MNETELAINAKQLPDRFADRLDAQHLESLRNDAAGGEWELLLQELLASLQAAEAVITPAECEHLGGLLASLDPDEVEDITVGPSLAERLQQIPVREPQ